MPVIDHWWQTETGWPVGCQLRGARRAAGEARVLRPAGAGLRRARADDEGRKSAPARPAMSSSSSRCRRAACRRCGTTTPPTWTPT